MVDALNKGLQHERGEEVFDQLLHGYSDGHRLLSSSRKLPDDLSRLMLRMSDLSGSNVTDGFDEYITGYPLTSLNAYALAKTWYAPEMSRPGCVWTHTILIPSSALRHILSLDVLQSLFRRPNDMNERETYSKTLLLTSILTAEIESQRTPEAISSLPDLFFHFYQNGNRPLLLPAKTSRQFESAIFALWSQQWPELRMHFTFCTGSLSARSYGKQPLDVQCVPVSRTREVSLAIGAEITAPPDILDSVGADLPSWALAAANDAGVHGTGEIRDFLWSVAGTSTDRRDFVSFIAIFDSLQESPTLADLIALLANRFPEASSGVDLKCRLLGQPQPDHLFLDFAEQDILLELATTNHFASFDGAQLSVKERGVQLCTSAPDSASWLLGQLFRASLNPLGEELLDGVMSAVVPEMALRVTNEHPELLPTLFRAKPDLAASASLWRKGGERKRELFESVASHEDLEPLLISSVVSAMLDTGADGLIRKALDRWGKDAVFQVLTWTDAHEGAMSEACRQALTFHVPSVMDWVVTHPNTTYECIVAIARVVAPYSYDIARYDSTVWLRTFKSLKSKSKETDKTYVCTFLLALAFGNSPPTPLELLSESFERVHEAASRNLLADDAWLIMEPLVPELSWYSNWDKCERLRRALVSAFIRHQWPASELRNTIRNREVRRQIVRSARKVDGGDEYLRDFHLTE
jgi:hypothetical protein